MLCSDCGTDLPDGASFCPKCSAPQKGVDCPITASGMVYLFADQFVERARLSGERVPCTDRLVKQNELSEMLVATAFIWLEANGLVTLNLERKTYRPSGILSTQPRFYDHVLVEKIGEYQSEEPNSLESAIWNTMDDTGNVFSLTLWAVDVESGTSPIVRFIRNHLLEQGYFLKIERKRWKIFTYDELVPNCERIALLTEQVDDTKRMIANFKQTKPKTYDQLFKDIRSAREALAPSDSWDHEPWAD